MKLIIVAAGLATRLQPITNYIPKILVNIGKNTALVELVEYWREYTHDITIITHSKFSNMIRAYFDLYYKDTNIKLTLIHIDEALGTAHTLSTALGKSYHGDDLMITWCDIIPKYQIETDMLTNSTVFIVSHDKNNRYDYQDGNLIQLDSPNGDVAGLYFIKDYHEYDFEIGQDFADVFGTSFGPLSSNELFSMIDFGDKPKLLNVLENADDMSREFNSLEFLDSLVHKKALNEQGKGIMNKEISWYQHLYRLKQEHSGMNVTVPDIFSNPNKDEFYMSYVYGSPIYEVFDNYEANEQRIILENVLSTLDNLNLDKTSVSREHLLNDVTIEAYEKVISRCSEIHDMIASFGWIEKVNGVLINTNLADVLTKMLSYITNYYDSRPAEYSFIHGDLQFSNSVLTSEDLDITFIDPRGYFGKTDFYGLPDYDKSKVLYSLSGYDIFNYSTDFHITSIKNREIRFKIPSLDIKFDYHEYFDKIHEAWLAIIWISLAGYIKNDPVKSVAAYYHGLSLATAFLQENIND